ERCTPCGIAAGHRLLNVEHCGRLAAHQRLCGGAVYVQRINDRDVTALHSAYQGRDLAVNTQWSDNAFAWGGSVANTSTHAVMVPRTTLPRAQARGRVPSGSLLDRRAGAQFRLPGLH